MKIINNIWNSLNKEFHSSSDKLLSLINEAEFIVVGIGSGLTSADGIGYSGNRFEDNFSDFIKQYKFLDMLQASLFHYPDWQTYWAFHSRFIKLNYLEQPAGKSFVNLYKILQKRRFFIITTNSDNSLEAAGFDNKNVFYIQGKYNLLQCSQMCHNQRYQNDELIMKMTKEQANMKVDYQLLPRCPKCDAFLEVNKRIAYKGMVEDNQFFEEQKAYLSFINEAKNKKTLFLEIGVGFTTPQLIKYPFWLYTKENPSSLYVVLNNKNYRIDKSILNQTIIFNDNLDQIIQDVETKQRS